MIITRYASLSLDEFINLLEDKAPYSPLVREALNRLSQVPTTCPVCDADILKYQKENT